ncbi:B12-binding domain-containing radical SAM protein [Planctomycetota bacterium]
MTTRKLRFLFVQPPFPRHYLGDFPVYEPLHVHILEAVTRDLAETRLFDGRFDSEEDFVRVLREYQPDIVGATTHMSGEIHRVKDLLAIAKKLRPGTLTIAGGQHATLLPEDLYDTCIDLVCIGPGEETFREVVETFASGGDFTKVDGLAVRGEKGYVLTSPRKICSGTFSWPALDWNLVSKRYKKKYFTFDHCPTIYTITTSGCPHRCSFCSLWAATRGTYRRRAPEEIVDDIVSQPQPYAHLTDDNTFHDEDHAMEIYRLLKERGVKKKIMAYARTDTIVKRPELLQKWAEVGLGALVVGMEAVTDKHLDSINKRTSVDVNIQAHRILENLGIENWAHFVIMPDFQKEDFDNVWDFVDSHNMPYPVFVPLTPIPGSPLFFEAKEKGQLSVFDYGFYNLTYMVMKTALPKEKWYEYYISLYKKSCSPRTLWRRRKSPSFRLAPALGRAYLFRRAVARGYAHIREQLHLERTVRYEDVEHTLPPSLRSDYIPDKYYNAPTLGAMKQTEAFVVPAASGGSNADAVVSLQVPIHLPE